MTEQDWIGFATLLLTGACALGGMSAFFWARLGDLRTEFDRGIERSEETSQAAMAALDTELRRIRDGAATRPELSAVETRLTLSIGKLETRMERIEVKLEPLPAMQVLLQQVVTSVEKISSVLLKERA